jgi:hypothetical protein
VYPFGTVLATGLAGFDPVSFCLVDFIAFQAFGICSGSLIYCGEADIPTAI